MTAPVRTNWKNRSGALLLVGAGLAVATSGAPALAKESNGNSGTIKVAFPTADAAPNNDAKPGCTVRLDFYGFNHGTYDAVFRAIAPTGSKQVASGSVVVTQPRTPASHRQTSKRFTLDVSGLTPSNAGYHIGVTVTNPAKSGNGGKHKSFYFDCRPGGSTRFTGGGGSVAGARSTARRPSRAGGGAVPAGGFDTGGGGTADHGVPLAPAAGLMGGLGLLGAGFVLRRRATS